MSNPGVILANAISCLVDGQGRILVDELKPDGIPDSIRSSLARVQVTGRGGPRIDPEWGEPGLTLAEKVYGWNTLEVLAFECGSPAAPVHAIPPSAWARCHMRYVAGCNPETFIPAVKKQLDKNGFGVVDVTPVRTAFFHATRTDPDSPWVVWSLASVEQTTGKTPTYLPNLGGSLPNEVFMYTLGLPTVWFPHSYAGCSQHAPDEHVLEGLISESLSMMTALFWDLGQRPPL